MHRPGSDQLSRPHDLGSDKLSRGIWSLPSPLRPGENRRVRSNPRQDTPPRGRFHPGALPLRQVYAARGSHARQ